MSNDIKTITKECYECNGEGFVSSCCSSAVDDNRCSLCQKFCKKEYCCEGNEIFKVGDEVRLFVCIYSPDNLKSLFSKKIKKLGDSVFKNCKITSIIDSYNIEIKVPYKGIIKVNIDEIDAL